MTLTAKDAQVEDGPEESEHLSHEPSYMMSTLSPKILVLFFPGRSESLNNNVLSDPVVYSECDFDHSS